MSRRALVGRAQSRSAVAYSPANPSLGRILMVRFDWRSLLVPLLPIMLGGYYLAAAGVDPAYALYAGGYRVFPVVFALALLVHCSHGRRLMLTKELKAFGLFFILLTVLSLAYQLVSGFGNDYLFEGLFALSYPMLFAFAVVNLFSAKQVYNTMVAVLVVLFAAYMIEMSSAGGISMAGLSTIDFMQSYSPYESSAFSCIAFSLAAFFCYFNGNKVWTMLAVAFSVLTFKRVYLVFAPVLLVVGLMNELPTRPTKGRTVVVAAVITIVVSVIYYVVLTPGFKSTADAIFGDILGADSYQLTMGRNEQLNYLLFRGFESSGYCSTRMWCPDWLEMELPRIFMELGVLGLALFSFYLWYVARKNVYQFVFMLGLVANLLLSWSLSTYQGWLVSYVLLFAAGVYKRDFEFHEGKQIGY